MSVEKNWVDGLARFALLTLETVEGLIPSRQPEIRMLPQVAQFLGRAGSVRFLIVAAYHAE